ncbi:unnamed protein product [Vitrella brassicaformis CCMP3155]|uniref:Uncharacterized protein n=1 Tax=Vitrella brassicaformis (strain CCMP3155) TaxID=1169540 RepID=A0A0G4ER91_VITBC|nr:unnamed protein product [Vitrella brassicaformis CCMP3155]|eukprot:CEM00524.1 unnamed protein product [Vitrella brassicaformis CCMP3155]
MASPVPDYEMDTAETEEMSFQDMLSFLMPKQGERDKAGDGEQSGGAAFAPLDKFAMGFSRRAFEGWVKQPSPCCAAASVASAWNAAMHLRRTDDKALDVYDAICVMQALVTEQLDGLRQKLARLLEGDLSEILDIETMILQGLKAQQKVLGAPKKDPHSVKNADILASLKEVLTTQIEQNVMPREPHSLEPSPVSAAPVSPTIETSPSLPEPLSAPPRPLSAVYAEGTTPEGQPARPGPRLSVSMRLSQMLRTEGKNDQQDDENGEADVVVAARENNAADGEGGEGEAANLPGLPDPPGPTYPPDSSPMDPSPLLPEDPKGFTFDMVEEVETPNVNNTTTPRLLPFSMDPRAAKAKTKAQKGGRRGGGGGVKGPSRAWPKGKVLRDSDIENLIIDLVKKRQTLVRLTPPQPATSDIGNWGVIGGIRLLSDSLAGPGEALKCRVVMGVRTRVSDMDSPAAGGPKEEVTFVSLSSRDNEMKVAYQWCCLKEMFARPNAVLLFHLTNHYALIYAWREWETEEVVTASSSSNDNPDMAPTNGDDAAEGETPQSAAAAAAERPRSPQSNSPETNANTSTATAPAAPKVTRAVKREVLTARKGQRPTEWISFEEMRRIMIGWAGYRLLMIERLQRPPSSSSSSHTSSRGGEKTPPNVAAAAAAAVGEE